MGIKSTMTLLAAAALVSNIVPEPSQSNRVEYKRPLTKKQAHKRAKNKAAKKSRKINRK